MGSGDENHRASSHRHSLTSSPAHYFFFSSAVTVAPEGQRERDGFRPANGLPPGNPSYLYSMSDWTIGTLKKRIGPKAFGIGEGRTSPWGPREQTGASGPRPITAQMLLRQRDTPVHLEP